MAGRGVNNKRGGSSSSSSVGGAAAGGNGPTKNFPVQEFSDEYSSGVNEDVARILWKIKNFDGVRECENLIKSQVIDVATDDNNINWQISLSIGKSREGQKYIGIMRKLEYTLKCQQLRVYNSMDVEVAGRSLTQHKKMLVTCDKPTGYNFVIPVMAPLEELHLVDGELVIKITLKTLTSLPSVMKKRKSQDEFEKEFALKVCKRQRSLLQSDDTSSTSSSFDPAPMTFSDVKLVSKDNMEFAAHKAILAVHSPVFKAMFQCNLLESKSGVVNITDLSGKTIKILLHLIYAGMLLEGWQEPETMKEVAGAVEKYQLCDCVRFLDEALGDMCTRDNVVGFLELATQLGLKNAEKECMKYFKARMSDVKDFEDVVKMFGSE